MGARKYDFDFGDLGEESALDDCLHDQQHSRSGVVPVRRTAPPTLVVVPRSATVPRFVVGQRDSAFTLHAAPRNLPIAWIFAGAVMFLAMTILSSIAYYR